MWKVTYFYYTTSFTGPIFSNVNNKSFVQITKEYLLPSSFPILKMKSIRQQQKQEGVICSSAPRSWTEIQEEVRDEMGEVGKSQTTGNLPKEPDFYR